LILFPFWEGVNVTFIIAQYIQKRTTQKPRNFKHIGARTFSFKVCERSDGIVYGNYGNPQLVLVLG